ncbi:marine proteobacterial sortase target protein [Alteromonas lipolytica]|uniref:Marine proteobacterial sortase target protein n=1 Tax=Alteromonas lipolytica TaxID=1856405 RepID=A0A1E8FJB0_9ALTE|nr:marine proteobacterial sortase target protein [Alteromonas lipolytica]OFI35836.1 marine proteobacterial sortase target protein [Alteromonas lipolytica]GGF81237.1 marine proteobacterial sortase target protein [Alteromonas lipolytica]
MYPKRIPKHLIFDPQPRRKSRAWLWWLVILIVTIAATLLSLVARADESAMVQAGQFRLTSASGQAIHAVHLATEVSAIINGLVVTTEYVQHFRNASDIWAEGTYVFPLPMTAAIQQMEMQIGERRISGEIKERKAAQVLYNQAKSAGQRAALTMQQRDNLFTQKVANIAPHQSIKVTLTFIDRVSYQDGLFEWRLPTTLTPRYIPGVSLLPQEVPHSNDPTLTTNQSGWAMATDQVPDAELITPPMTDSNLSDGPQNPLQLSVTLQAGMELAAIKGLYHELAVQQTPQHYELSFARKQEEMNRDVVIQWQPVAANVPRAALFQQTQDNETYAMLMMIPPTAQVKQPLAKDILFVIDISGSMQGKSIIQAKASLAEAIEQLAPDDRFNIIAFNDEFNLFNDRVVAANSDIKPVAQHWVASLQADGGTEMYPAMQAAYDQLRATERLQQIVFITDGAIGNEAALFDLITATGHDARLFTVGIGSAPNAFFMRKAAQLGRGSFELIGSTNEVQQRITRLLAKLNHVVATNIQIGWPLTAEAYPAKPADLFYNEALVSFAKLPQPIEQLPVQGDKADKHWQTTINGASTTAATAIGSLWARHKIIELEDQGRTGSLDKDTVRNLVLGVALEHRLLTRYTAFIAIDSSPARPIKSPLRSQSIANVMPAGSAQQAVMFAQTASTATLSFWLGLLGCSLLGVLSLHKGKAGASAGS